VHGDDREDPGPAAAPDQDFLVVEGGEVALGGDGAGG
jgi:hypothetical protein